MHTKSKRALTIVLICFVLVALVASMAACGEDDVKKIINDVTDSTTGTLSAETTVREVPAGTTINNEYIKSILGEVKLTKADGSNVIVDLDNCEISYKQNDDNTLDVTVKYGAASTKIVLNVASSGDNNGSGKTTNNESGKTTDNESGKTTNGDGTTNGTGDNGTTKPNAGDNGNTNPGGDNGNTNPNTGDNGNTNPNTGHGAQSEIASRLQALARKISAGGQTNLAIKATGDVVFGEESVNLTAVAYINGGESPAILLEVLSGQEDIISARYVDGKVAIGDLGMDLAAYGESVEGTLNMILQSMPYAIASLSGSIDEMLQDDKTAFAMDILIRGGALVPLDDGYQLLLTSSQALGLLAASDPETLESVKEFDNEYLNGYLQSGSLQFKLIVAVTEDGLIMAEIQAEDLEIGVTARAAVQIAFPEEAATIEEIAVTELKDVEIRVPVRLPQKDIALEAVAVLHTGKILSGEACNVVDATIAYNDVPDAIKVAFNGDVVVIDTTAICEALEIEADNTVFVLSGGGNGYKEESKPIDQMRFVGEWSADMTYEEILANIEAYTYTEDGEWIQVILYPENTSLDYTQDGFCEVYIDGVYAGTVYIGWEGETEIGDDEPKGDYGFEIDFDGEWSADMTDEEVISRLVIVYYDEGEIVREEKFSGNVTIEYVSYGWIEIYVDGEYFAAAYIGHDRIIESGVDDPWNPGDDDPWYPDEEDDFGPDLSVFTFIVLDDDGEVDVEATLAALIALIEDKEAYFGTVIEESVTEGENAITIRLLDADEDVKGIFDLILPFVNVTNEDGEPIAITDPETLIALIEAYSDGEAEILEVFLGVSYDTILRNLYVTITADENGLEIALGDGEETEYAAIGLKISLIDATTGADCSEAEGSNDGSKLRDVLSQIGSEIFDIPQVAVPDDAQLL